MKLIGARPTPNELFPDLRKKCGTCAKYKSPKTTWFTDPVSGIVNRCHTCYAKALEAASDKMCHRCPKTGPGRYYKTQDKKYDICNRCYKNSLPPVTYKTCHLCKEKRSTQWYTDPDHPTKDRCRNCYNKANPEKARGTKRNSQKVSDTEPSSQPDKWYITVAGQEVSETEPSKQLDSWHITVAGHDGDTVTRVITQQVKSVPQAKARASTQRKP
jgi:hypothetical protein